MMTGISTEAEKVLPSTFFGPGEFLSLIMEVKVWVA